jgi:hypothetical protein
MATPSFRTQRVTYKGIYLDPAHVIKTTCVVAAGNNLRGGTVVEFAAAPNATKVQACTVGANAIGVLEQPVDATNADQIGTLILHAYLSEADCVMPAAAQIADAKAAMPLIIWG